LKELRRQPCQSQPDVFFEAGDHEHLVKVGGDQFKALQSDAEPADVAKHIRGGFAITVPQNHLGIKPMRMFDAEPRIIDDLKDECEIAITKQHGDYRVLAARHPTLGKVVIVEDKDGSGVIVETEE